MEQSQTLLLRQFLFQHGGLVREHTLATHQLDRVIPKNDGGASHLADLVAPFRSGNVNIRVVDRETVHAVGQLQQGGRDRAADIK